MLAYAKHLLSGPSWKAAPQQQQASAREAPCSSAAAVPAAPVEQPALKSNASAKSSAPAAASQQQQQTQTQTQTQAEQQQPLELEDIFVADTLIGNRYQVIKKLGDGTTSDVFICKDLLRDDMVAVKVVKVAMTDGRGVLPHDWAASPPYARLCKEASFYRRLWDAKDLPMRGISVMHDFQEKWVSPVAPGSQASVVYSFMSMQLLGTPVELLAMRLVYRADPSLFITHASSMLQALRCLHEHGLVHGDVKNANFCTELQDSRSREYQGSNPSAVYILDLEFAEDLTRLSTEARNTADIPNYKGTVDYSSLRTLDGYPSTPLDDCFALGDCMLEMLLGDLPWCLDRIFRDATDIVQYDRTTATTTTSSSKSAEASCYKQLSWPHNVLPQLAAAKKMAVARYLKQDACPALYRSWHAYLSSLSPTSAIDYDHLQRLVTTAAEQERAQQQRQQQQLGVIPGAGIKVAVSSAAVSCAAEQAQGFPDNSNKRGRQADGSCCDTTGSQHLPPPEGTPARHGCTPKVKKQRQDSSHGAGSNGSPGSEE